MKYIKYIPLVIILILLLLLIRAEYKNNLKSSLMGEIAIEAENQKIAREKAEAPSKLLESFRGDRRNYQKNIDNFKLKVKKYQELKYKSEMKIRCQKAFLIQEHESNCSKKENFEKFPLK